MYARVARFEGLDASRIDEGAAERKRQMEAARSGSVPAGAPEQVATLMQTVKRVVELVDREQGTMLAIMFTGTEEDMARADAALNAMSPTEGEGRRTSKDVYEVVLDESF